MKHTTFDSYKCYIIAEIGINHDGINSKARELIKLAQRSGVHAVKFQYRNLENAYSSQAKEIGDEILSKEINRSYLSPDELLELSIFAKNLNLEVGISFFDEKDILDFGTDIKVFDFFKIPSVELTNSSLIDSLMKLNRHVYISLGAHDEKEIELALSQLSSMGCWTPMHCISNYPVNLQNAQPDYIIYNTLGEIDNQIMEIAKNKKEKLIQKIVKNIKYTPLSLKVMCWIILPIKVCEPLIGKIIL